MLTGQQSLYEVRPNEPATTRDKIGRHKTLQPCIDYSIRTPLARNGIALSRKPQRGGLDHLNGPLYWLEQIFREALRRVSHRSILYTQQTKVYHFQGVVPERRKITVERT